MNDGDSWVKIREVDPCDVLRSTVDKLKKDVTYKFRVSAVNDGGKGFPSQLEYSFGGTNQGNLLGSEILINCS